MRKFFFVWIGLSLAAYLIRPSISMLITVCACLLAYCTYRYYDFVWRYPKGPFPLPFIGNLREIVFNALHKSQDRFGKRQNGLYTLFIPFPIVQITDFEVLREAFVDNGDAYTGRPQNEILQEVFSFAPNSDSNNFSARSAEFNRRPARRTALAILRDFGMCKNVRSSVEEFLRHLETIPDKANADLQWPIQVMVANAINEVLFGFRYKYGDCKPLMDYVLLFNEMMSGVMRNKGVALAMALPFLTKIPWIRWHSIGKSVRKMKKIHQFVVENVNRAIENYCVDDEPTCFVHAYKQRMEHNPNLDAVNLISTCADFFHAGQETTSNTLKWATIITAKHSEIQEKLRCEIRTVVGDDRLPTMADQVKGQLIPAGTWVNGDIHFLMANDAAFERPELFCPDRYLSSDGLSLKKNLVERTLPFSLGKRSCAGESLARVEIFLAITSMIQRYRILPCEGEEIDLEPVVSAIHLLPKPQKLRLEKVL